MWLKAESVRGEAPIRDPSSLVSSCALAQISSLLFKIHNVQLTYCSNAIVQCSMGHCSVGKVFNRTNVKYANVQLIIGQLTDWNIVQRVDVQFVLVQIDFWTKDIIQKYMFRYSLFN